MRLNKGIKIRTKTMLLVCLVLNFFLLSKHTLASKEDSLINLFKKSKIDTIRYDLAARIYSLNTKKGNFDNAKIYLDSIFSIAAKINNERYYSSAYHLKANYFYRINQFDSAIVYDNKSINTASKINYYLPLIRCHVNLGNIYNQKADYKKAIFHLHEGEQYAIKAKDTLGQITTILNVGNIYYYLNDYKQAKSNFNKVINLCKKTPLYKHELTNAYNNFGTIYLNETPKKLDSAMYYYLMFHDLSEELGIENNIALANFNIAEVHRLSERNKEAKLHYLIADSIYRTIEDTVGIMKVCLSLSDVYIVENQNEKAVLLLNEGLKYSIDFEIADQTADFYKTLSTAYYNIGKYKESIDFYKMGALLSDSLYNAENSKILYDMQTKYETDEKERQNKLLEAENIISTKTIKQQQLITYVIIGGLILTLLLAFFIFRGLRIQRKANKIIFQQKLIVEEHQKEILDSIHYAKRIQNTLLAHKEFVDQFIPNNFIYFNPKDIVSGDFYWATKKDKYFYFAVCDSTGHGVPGAFMSLLNIGFLNEAINEKNIIEPASIFNYARERLISSVSKDGQKDGFDGILLRINLVTKEMVYAAANNKPVVISNNVIKHLPADKMPVGYGERKEDFSQHTIEMNEGDTIYLYTDGYADQFGGPKGKKFKYKPLDEFLLSIVDKPLSEQAECLNVKFNEWKGNLEQVDDVAVFGLKL